MNDFLDKLTQECFDVADDGKGKKYLRTPAGVKKIHSIDCTNMCKHCEKQ